MKPWRKILFFFLSSLFLFFEFPSRAEESFLFELKIPQFVIFQQNTLFPIPSQNTPKKTKKIIIPAIVTAYSSTPWETDQDPFVTAAGTLVRDGVVANNLLPFKTKIKIPEIFGDKVFVVEDRMNKKCPKHQFDVWFEDYFEALNFGKKETYVEILPNEN